MRNYKNISAEGQYDGKLCWAACLAWWTRATDRLNREQDWFQEEFSQLWEPPRDGTIDDDGMKRILSDLRWRMYWEPVKSQVKLTPGLMRRYLNYGAVYLGYYDSNISSPHVNVIYAMTGGGSDPQVSVMEPRHTMNSDGSFQGAHLTRTLSYYKSPGCTIYIACARPWSA